MALFLGSFLALTLSVPADTSSVAPRKSNRCIVQKADRIDQELCNYSVATFHSKLIDLLRLDDASINTKTVEKQFELSQLITPPDNVYEINVIENGNAAYAIIQFSEWRPPPKDWRPSGWLANLPLPVISKYGERRLFVTLDSNPKACLSFKSLKSSAIRYGWRGSTQTVQVADGIKFQSLELHRNRSFISIKEEADGCVRDLKRTVEFNP